ncbi:MAG: hypothetical protein Q9162_003515 [Coniocarpon cinnabarinum]
MSTVEEQQNAVRKLQQAWRARPPRTMRDYQAAFSDIPVRGSFWVCPDRLKAPTDSNLLDVFSKAVEHECKHGEQLPSRHDMSLHDVSLEWIAQRTSTPSSEAQPASSVSETFARLMADVRQPMTIVYLHGGAFFVGNPKYARTMTTALAGFTQARVASVAYRLAPQYPFPYAVLDILMVWLRLLYPKQHGMHHAVSPKSVILAGDSAGGNLALAVIQAILTLRRLQKTNEPMLRFDGRDVEVPMPAGVTALSPFLDMSEGLPSYTANRHIDFLADIPVALTMRSDDLWPTRPPRGDPYTDPSTWLHPFVTPALAEHWEGAPPLWMACGQERLSDSQKLLVARCAQQGVTVLFSEYRGMPHCFAGRLHKLPQTRRCYETWAKACLRFCDPPSTLKSFAEVIEMPGNAVKVVDPTAVSSLSLEEAGELIRIACKWRKPWTGSVISRL